MPIVLIIATTTAGCGSVRGRSTLLMPPPNPRATAGSGDEAEEPRIQPDRPDVTNAAYTVPRGLTQVEGGGVQTRVTSSGETTSTPVSSRTGVAHWAELRIETDGLTREVQAGSTVTNFGGLAAGLKVRLWAPASGSPAIALQPEVTFPWGRADAGSDYQLRVLSGGDITKAVHLDVNYGVGSIASGDSRFVQHMASASANVTLAQHWQPYAEVYWVSRFQPDARPGALIDVGAIYLVDARVAVDGGAAFGLTASANGPSLFGGLSVMLGEIAGHRVGVETRMREAQLRGDR